MQQQQQDGATTLGCAILMGAIPDGAQIAELMVKFTMDGDPNQLTMGRP
eukprot:SAG31_NODE_18404_length_637_cov_2.637546_1_plen_48_part_10